MVDASARGDVDVWWQVGGNFLETLADESHSRAALARPSLRIHQDIVLSSAMLVDPADTVIVLPAATRYESPGGGTETSTERRIIYSPEIPGRRIGSARAEWEVFRDVVARAFPESRAIRGVSRRGVDPRGHRARGAAVCRDRTVVGEGRSDSVGRTLAVRERTVRDHRWLRAFYGR